MQGEAKFTDGIQKPWGSDDYEPVPFEARNKGGSVYLPHSCDEWVIGGREEVEALIADLQELLKSWPDREAGAA